MQVLDVPFQVTGGDPKRPSPNVNSTIRNVTIDSKVNTNLERWDGNKVWLLIPGFTAPSDGLDSRLLTQIINANPRDIVLALDWTEISGSDIGTSGIVNGDLYRSVSWVTPLAEAVVQRLFEEWGVSSSALNIIGHSIGAYAANEIAFQFNRTLGRIGSLTALDPASNQARRIPFNNPYDDVNGYDTDLRNGFAKNSDPRGVTPDPIKPFQSANAVITRSFNGSLSGAGNERQSGTARESILIDFNGKVGSLPQHSAVIDVFSNIITTDSDGNAGLARNFLSTTDTLADHLLLPDNYKGFAPNSAQVHEVVIASNADFDPLFAVALGSEPRNGIRDTFIYITNSDDTIDGNKINGNEDFAKKYYNDALERVYYLGEGNDSLGGEFRLSLFPLIAQGINAYGDGGDDTLTGFEGRDLFYGGDQNDSLLGGKGNDTLIGDAGNDRLFGEEGDDLVIGGIDNDTLFGGSGFNTLQGFAIDSNNKIVYPTTERDTLVHSSNSQNVFVLNLGTENAYNKRGSEDVARIIGYQPSPGGLNQAAQGGDVVRIGLRSNVSISSGGLGNTIVSDRLTFDLMAVIEGIPPNEVIFSNIDGTLFFGA